MSKLPAAAAPGSATTEAMIEQNIRINTVHGMFSSAALNMVGPFVAIFAMKAGATKLHVALLTSAPAIVSLLAMIPGALLIDRSASKKRMTLRFMLGHRLFFVIMAAVPFLPQVVRATAFVTLVALMNLPGSISNVAWQAFISRIVPPSRRAAAFASRNRLMSLVATGTTVAVGLFLDRMVFPWGYQIAFAGAFLVAIVELAIFNRIDETAQTDGGGAPTAKPPASPRMGGPYPPLAVASSAPAVAFLGRTHEALRRRWADLRDQPRFVRYTLVSMLFYLAWQIPWPLFSWYQVRVLHANATWVSLFALMNTGGSLVGFGFWRRMIERHGNLKVLFISTLPIFTTPLAYAFSSDLLTIALANLMIGVIFSGVGMALFNTLLEMTPEENKTTFIAYFNTAVTLSAIAAPLIGIGLLNLMDFRAAFLTTAGIRFGGSLAYLVLYRREAREGGVSTPSD